LVLPPLLPRFAFSSLSLFTFAFALAVALAFLVVIPQGSASAVALAFLVVIPTEARNLLSPVLAFAPLYAAQSGTPRLQPRASQSKVSGL
jgi:hypothetical protein